MKSWFSGLAAVVLSILCAAVPASAGVDVTPVPEPATGLLIALGIGGVMWMRRKSPPEK